MHRGAFFQILFLWIHYCHCSKSTRKETGKTHLCAMWQTKYASAIPKNFGVGVWFSVKAISSPGVRSPWFVTFTIQLEKFSVARWSSNVQWLFLQDMLCMTEMITTNVFVGWIFIGRDLWNFELWICEFVNSELFLSKFSRIHENWVYWRGGIRKFK